MVGLKPRSRPATPQKKPDRCVKATSFSCKNTCLPKFTKSGKRTICHTPLAGQAKVAVEWLANQDPVTRDLNLRRQRIDEGKGRLYVDKEGKIQEEKMYSYLTGTRRSYVERADELNSKAEQAEAIAKRAKRPDQIKRATLLAEKLRGQANKILEWGKSQGKRVREAVQKKRQERQPEIKTNFAKPSRVKERKQQFIETEEVKPTVGDRVTELVNGITSNVNKLKRELKKQTKTETPKNELNIPERSQQKGQRIGKGVYGEVFLDGDRVIKYGKISESEAAIGQKAASLGVGPKVYGTQKMKDGKQALAMEFVAGQPLIASGEYNDDGSLKGDTFDRVFLAMFTLHRSGIAHGDLHQGNIIKNGNKVQIIDYGFARQNDPNAVIREMLKPAFLMSQSFDSEGNHLVSIRDTPDSKLRSRYDSAKKEFIDKYGDSGENWPTGQSGADAIIDFYKKILGK